MLRVDIQILINLLLYITAIYISLYYSNLTKIIFYKASGKPHQDMKQMSSKSINRIEKKKKKMAALLEISKLNEHDRTKNSHIANIELNNIEAEPSPKKLRTEQDRAETPTQILSDIGASGKPKLSGEDYLQLKRLLREKTKKMRNEPKFRLREIGEGASLTVDLDDRIPLFLSDIQHLLMYAQVGCHASYCPTRWCQLEKFNSLHHTNVLIIENVSLYHYQSHESLFPFLNSNFATKLEIITPGAYKGDTVQDLATVPLTGTQVNKYLHKYGKLEKAVLESSEVFDRIKNLFPLEKKIGSEDYTNLPKSDKFPRTQLLLSGWQMVEENFPLPIKGLMETKYAGYVLTKDSYKDVTPRSPMFGIDCEMCRTTIGDLELTRVSVVDEKYQLFYEELVKPDNKIIDYLTKYSGITPNMMRNVTKRLADVQEDLRRLLPADAILVGQSIGNDLHALKMMHPYIIDTSVIYNITGDRTRKTKLQTLSQHFLDERIQEGHAHGGHCSIEDSSASLKLAQHKLANDLHYGDALMVNISIHVVHHPELGHPHYATSMLKHVTKMDRRALIIGLTDVTPRYIYYTYKDHKPPPSEKKISFISEKNNQNVIKKFCDYAKGYTMNIAHVGFTDSQIEREMTKVCKQIDQWVQVMYETTASPGLFVVILGGQSQAGSGCGFITIKRSS